MGGNSKAAEEKAQKAMVDAGRLADELRAEQDHYTAQEKAVKTTGKVLDDLSHRLRMPAFRLLLVPNNCQSSLKAGPGKLSWSSPELFKLLPSFIKPSLKARGG